MSEKHSCGSSWIGFWKRRDRGQVWLEFATAARNTHNGYVAAANIVGTEKSSAAMRHLRKLCGWALVRAEMYGVDWRTAGDVSPYQQAEFDLTLKSFGPITFTPPDKSDL